MILDTRRQLMADIAEELALKPIRGGNGTEFQEIIKYFHREDETKFFEWCAAFVYHCSVLAGFDLPIKYPEPAVKYRFASVQAWQEWAMLPEIGFYHHAADQTFTPEKGDLVIYDNIVGCGPHDHIGIILYEEGEYIITAEGNIANASGSFRRKKTEYVNGYIRIRDGYCYSMD